MKGFLVLLFGRLVCEFALFVAAVVALICHIVVFSIGHKEHVFTLISYCALSNHAASTHLCSSAGTTSLQKQKQQCTMHNNNNNAPYSQLCIIYNEIAHLLLIIFVHHT